MDAARALADLAEISSQIEAAVLVGPKGEVLGSTIDDEQRAHALAEAAGRLLEQAGDVQGGSGAPTQLEAATPQGSVFVVRDGGRTIVATTSPEPTVGLVFYDLKSCLHAAAEPAEPEPAAKKTAKAPPKAAAKAPAAKGAAKKPARKPVRKPDDA